MLILPFADESTGLSANRPTPQPRADGEQSKSTAPKSDAVAEGQLEDEEQASVGEEINVMLVLLLPWAISILLHLGIVLLAFFVVWSYAVEEEEDEIIPEARMLNDEPSELLVYSENLEVTATTDVPREIETQTVAKGDPLSALNTETASDLALIGVTGSKALPAGSRIGKDPFGVGMYGVGGNARTIVYCVDASGSLVDTLPFVIDELKNSLRKLIPEQRFAVIFFQANEALYPFRGLRPATPQNIRAASDVMCSDAVVPHGSSNPEQAITQALSYRPDLIYILSDNITGKGQYAIDREELLELISKTKQARGATNTRINTIQFLYPDPLGTLKTVAEEHDGRYRFVDASVVGSR